MRELIYDNVRIQFLSEEVLRLEDRYGAYFTDRNTLWIPDRGAFEKAGKRLPESQSRSRENQGRQQSLVVREEAAQEHSRPQRFLLGDLLLVLPNPKEGLRGLQIFREGKCVYQYERVKINGKLPAPAQTPWIYPLLDVPRILLPEKNCSTSEKKKYPAMGCGGSLSSGVQKRCKKAPGSVCLSDRKGRYAPGGCIGGSKN